MKDKYFNGIVDASMLEKGAYHSVVNGNHFIFLEPLNYKNGCPYDEEVLEWLDSTLNTVTTADPDSYVFVCTHPAIYETIYGSTSDLGECLTVATRDLDPILTKYPQVISFNGHLHYPINDERTIMQTTYTAVGTGSTRHASIEAGYENAPNNRPVGRYSVSNGLLVEVDINGNVRITRLYFTYNDTIKDAWELSHPTSDGAHLTKYTSDRSQENEAPVMSGEIGVDITADAGTVTKVTVNVPAATDDDMVHHYEVIVKDNSTGVSKTYKYLSDFYRVPNPEDMATVYSMDLPEAYLTEGEYTVSVSAVDSWGAKSNKLERKITVTGANS